MGRIKNNVLGDISGKVGNKVFRSYKGKQIVAERPTNYIIKSTALKAVQTKFAASVKFSKFICSIDPLETVWHSVKPEESTTFNWIQHHNLKKFINPYPNTSILITPPGFESPFRQTILQNNCLIVKMNISEIPDYTSGTLVTIAVFLNPVNAENSNLFEMTCFLYSLNELKGENEIIIKLNDEQKALSFDYKAYILFSSIIRFSENKKLAWSSTFTHEGLMDK